MSVQLFLAIAALICFLLATFGVSFHPKINMVALGLACLALVILILIA